MKIRAEPQGSYFNVNLRRRNRRKDKNMKENYIKEKMDTEDLSIDIPKGKVFVMGDNRNHSLDSRKLGYFDFKDDVIGKVFFKIPL